MITETQEPVTSDTSSEAEETVEAPLAGGMKYRKITAKKKH